MKRHISIFAFLLCAFAALSAVGGDNMRLSPIGYRLGDNGVITAYDPSVVTVTPSDTSIVTAGNSVTLKAALNRDYKVVRWQKFGIDPRVRDVGPLEEFGAGAESVSVAHNADVDWMYVVVVVKYDPVRTVKTGLSSFSKGSVSVNPSKTSYQKGDGVTLTAEAAGGYSFVRWSDGNADHKRTLTVDDDIDLTAYIEPNANRVSFSAGEGAVLDMTEKTVRFGYAYGELPVPAREGQVFVGWKDEFGKPITSESTSGRVGDHVLTAVWEIPPESYTVVFDANGGMGTQTRVNQVFEVGVAQKLRINTFYKPGSVFVGWNQNAGAEEKQYSDEQIVQDLAPVGATLTLFAVWRAEKVAYTVHFSKNAADATGEMIDQQFAGGEEKPLSGCTFRRTGWTFLGWSTDSGAIEATYRDREKVQDLTAQKELTLYAVWTKNPVYYVNYMAMDRDSEPWKSETVEQEKEYTLSATDGLARTGYTFAGWTNGTAKATYPAGKKCTTQELEKMADGGDTITFVALWKPITYTLKFDGNGGTCKLTPKTLTYDVPATIGFEGGKVSRDHYEFQFWSADPKETNLIYRWSSSYEPEVTNLTTVADGTVVWYAIWRGTNVTVTINGKTEQLEYGSQLEKPADPEPQVGRTFTGNWKTGDGVIVEFPIVVTGSIITLDPVWTTNKYKITFNTAGGSAIAPVTYEYDTAITAPAAPTRTGYAFAGWYEGTTAFVFGKMPARDVALTAHWTANTYTVKFNPGEGSGKMTDQSFTYDVAQALKLNSFEAPQGKVFACWTNAVNRNTYSNGQTVKNLTSVSGGIITLYATWTKAPSYTVAFHGAGGTNATGAATYQQAIECGKATALAGNAFVRTGYGFAGWAVAASSGSVVVYTNGQVVTDLVAEGKTKDLYAKWTPNRYWVKFDGNGADGGTMADQAFTYDVAQMLTRNAFTRTGHRFVGWANETATGMSPPLLEDGAVVSNLTAEPNATNTLRATWAVKSYEISFDSAGGSAVGPVTNEFGKAVSAPTPVRTGYAFTGWYEGTDLFDFSSMPARNVRLTAHWSDPNNYTVRFNGNGGTSEAGKSTYDQTFAYDEEKALMPNAFVRTGHAFANWTNASGKVYADGVKVKNLASAEGVVVNLYAVWTVEEYECTFDGKSDGKKKYGEKITRADPTMPGYTFKGWTLNGSDIVNLSTFTMPDHDVAFTSKWTPITYTITFNGNGATSGTMSSVKGVKYDTAINLPANKYLRTGYEFLGWARAQGAASADWGDGASVKNLAKTDGETVTLYAVWGGGGGNPLSIALGVPGDWTTTSTPATAWEAIGGPGEGLRTTVSDPSGVKDIALKISFPEAGEVYLEFKRCEGAQLYFDPDFTFNDVQMERRDWEKVSSLPIPEEGTLTLRYAPDQGYWTLKITNWKPGSAK